MPYKDQTAIPLPRNARDRVARHRREGETWADTIHRLMDELEDDTPGGDR